MPTFCLNINPYTYSLYVIIEVEVSKKHSIYKILKQCFINGLYYKVSFKCFCDNNICETMLIKKS